MKSNLFIFTKVLLLSIIFLGAGNHLTDSHGAEADEIPPRLKLVEAVMCESIQALLPRNSAVVFSIENGKVACFTHFDPVPEKMFVYHRWFFKDELSITKKLFLQPPRWSTYSSIQLREADRGPWRVEIADQNGKILKILRFSVTD